MGRSDDELANTAAISEQALAQTVASGADEGALARTRTSGAGTPSPRELQTLGRLRLERVLGSGGMGIVYAAFDPDLERRVAVKLLHAGDADARARLLREARAMAKLSHANVITVFDVGSAAGEDFVTMELIDGETLKDWLARARPSWRESVRAFIHAGRGLAAAHDAGLVHRDFKPANVLRSIAGKVVVTDFGLSRAAGAGDVVDATGNASSYRGPSTKTATGALLGTPAYMAPEQWTGGAIGPATDQFAFCVALAEALAGERPFRGDTVEEIKSNVLAGPGNDDAIPRPVRAILRRGLAPDPAARWPSMTALLAALEHALARRRRWLGLAAAIAIGTVGTIAVLASRPAGHAGVDCSPPALDVDRVWSPTRAAAVARRDPESAAALAADLAVWRQRRARACAAAPASRSPELACLDGVLARFDFAASAIERGAPSPGVEGTASLLVDPGMCTRVPAPRLSAEIDRELAIALEGFRVFRNGGKLGPATTTSPCARALELRTRIATVDVTAVDVPALSGLMHDLREASELADRCTDDAIKAQVLLGLAYGSPKNLARADAAVAAFPQDDLLGELDLLHGQLRGADGFELASADFERALDRFGKRHRSRGQVRAIVSMLDALIAHSRPADLARVAELVATWRIRASADDRSALDQRAARARWRLGDVEGADALARDLGSVPPTAMRSPLVPAIAMQGTVVDEAGQPVAGAEVVASRIIDSDSVDAAAPLELFGASRARTDDHGAFAMAGARGLAVASIGTRRSAFAVVAPTVVFVVHSTVRLTGKVALGALEPTRVRVTLAPADPRVRYDEIAPVRADGSFELDHALRGKMTIVAREYGVETGDPPQALDVSGDAAGISVTAQVARPLYVIARNTGMTTPDLALLFLYAGHAPAHATLNSLGNKPLLEFEANTPPAELPGIVKPRLQPDDLYGALSGRPTARVFVCTVGVTRDMFSLLRTQKAFVDAFGVAELGCVDIAPDDPVAIVEIPPLRKPRVTGP